MIEEINLEGLHIVDKSQVEKCDESKIMFKVAAEITDLITKATTDGDLFVTHSYHVCCTRAAESGKIMDAVFEQFRTQAPKMACFFLSIGHGYSNNENDECVAQLLMGSWVPEELRSLGLETEEWENHVENQMDDEDDVTSALKSFKLWAADFATNKLRLAI